MITLLSLFASTAQAAGRHESTPDTVLYNGDVITMDAAAPRANAIAIVGQRIVSVGDSSRMLKLAGPQTRRVDLKGRTVIPGLIDTHIHAIRGGQTFEIETHWYDQATLSSALRVLQTAAAQRPPGNWVAVVGGWHPDQFTERRAPTTDELTAALPDHPAYVQQLYSHAILNRRAIEVLALDNGSAMPAGIVVERDGEGRATGRLVGGIGPLSALFARIAERSPQQARASLKAFFATLSRSGVTGIVDPAAGDYASYSPVFSLWRDHELTVRVSYRVSALAREHEALWFRGALAYLPPRSGDEMLRFAGMGENLVAGINDGVRQAPGFQASAQAREELYRVAMLAAERGYALEAHAYTDDAANQILDVFERVALTSPIASLRWSLAHINTGRAETFDRMKRLGISYTVQMGPYFEASEIVEANGPSAAVAASPTRLALDRGIVVAGGTDATRIGEINVWKAIEYHVTGRSAGGLQQRDTSQLLSREEALRLYTANAAWITFDDAERGTLSPGKQADLVVLDMPYLKLPADRIHAIRSALTLVGGKVVYKDRSF